MPSVRQHTIKHEIFLENLKSDRIILRPILMNDARDIFSYRSQPDIYRFQSWQPKTISDVEQFIGSQIVDEPNLPNTWYQLSICKFDSGELLGDCGIHFLEKESSQVEIGVTLKKEAQGLGYAT